MTKTPNIRTKIESYREKLTALLSGAETVKRLNSFNWLRHEIAYVEPKKLFSQTQGQHQFLDFTNMANIGIAYDYIVNNPDKEITADEIRHIHELLCNGTNIAGGALRTTNKIIEITVNGERMRAPDAREVEYLLNQIAYDIRTNRQGTLNKAYKAHYELIALQPFDDFNKRTARLVMNWILISGGYRPIIFNKPGDKADYRNAIRNCAEGHEKAYRTFMDSCLLRTQKAILNQLTKSKI